MPLLDAQLPALKADILADPALALLASQGALGPIATAYNQNAAPSFWVWKTLLEKRTVTSETSVDGTTFSFPVLIARSAGEQFGWEQVWNSVLTCNPSLANVRQAFQDIFSGAGGAAMRTHMAAMSRRLATRAEKLFATGTGSTASPGLMAFEGALGDGDVERALRV